MSQMELKEWMKSKMISGSGNSFYFSIGLNKFRVSNHPRTSSEFHIEYLEKDTIDIVVDNPKKLIKRIYGSLSANRLIVQVSFIFNNETVYLAINLSKTVAESWNEIKKFSGFKIIRYIY